MKTLVLWDIDHTLLYSGGAGAIGQRRAFRDLYGEGESFMAIEFSGRTDWAIFHEAAVEFGIDPDRAMADMPRFIDAYIPHLEAALGEVTGGTLKPGVEAVLAALDLRVGVVQALGTGNFRRAAEVKLRHFGIDRYFPGCAGGFGEDSADRHEVIALGIERLCNGAVAERIVVIGDTPHDVSAAKACGAFALGVGTGDYSAEDLLACGADAALPDLTDLERALNAICRA